MAASKEKRDAKNSGFIFLHRSIRENWIWSDAKKLKWWLDILMECNHSDQKVNIGYDLIDCNRGQSLNSLLTWGKRWRVDVSTVRRFFDLLEKAEMIHRENVLKTTRITVCNYDTYNNIQQSKQSQSNRKAIATQFGDNTNNNDTNNEEEREGKPAPKNFKQLSKEEFKESLRPFIEKYGQGMIIDFGRYWSEPNENGVMRFQLEKTWSASGRLSTWKKRQEQIDAERGSTKFQKGNVPSLAATSVLDAEANKILNDITPKNGTKKQPAGEVQA